MKLRMKLKINPWWGRKGLHFITSFDLANINYFDISFDLKPSYKKFFIKLTSYSHFNDDRICLDITNKFLAEAKLNYRITYSAREVTLKSEDFILDINEAERILICLFSSIFSYADLSDKDQRLFNSYCQSHGLNYEWPDQKSEDRRQKQERERFFYSVPQIKDQKTEQEFEPEQKTEDRRLKTEINP